MVIDMKELQLGVWYTKLNTRSWGRDKVRETLTRGESKLAITLLT